MKRQRNNYKDETFTDLMSGGVLKILNNMVEKLNNIEDTTVVAMTAPPR
jgi:hypothetical protein